MRFAASPLLVAVAFGFLGPIALDAEEEDLDEVVSTDTSDASTSSVTDATDLPVEAGE